MLFRFSLIISACCVLVAHVPLSGAAGAEDVPPAPPPWKVNRPIVTVEKEIYLEHPAPRVAPWVSIQYVGPKLEVREVRGLERQSDVGEQIRARWSADNGRTWSEFVPVQPSNNVNYAGVTVWEGEGASVYDPTSGRLVQLRLRQITVQGVYHNFTYVRTSRDLGHTWSEPRGPSGPISWAT